MDIPFVGAGSDRDKYCASVLNSIALGASSYRVTLVAFIPDRLRPNLTALIIWPY